MTELSSYNYLNKQKIGESRRVESGWEKKE
jgi:hypothetical protein